MFHCPHKRPAPSWSYTHLELWKGLVQQWFPLERLSATVKSTLVPPSECLFDVQRFWMSEHAGKFLLWKIQSWSKSYNCPPRQSFTFTCISENPNIWLNLVNDVNDSPFMVPAAVELDILSHDIWACVYEGGIGFQLSTLALQRLVPKVWFLLCLYKPYMRKVWNDVSVSAWQKPKSCSIRDVTSQREVFSVAVGCSDLIGHDGCSTGNKRDLAEVFKWVSERHGTGPIQARLEAEEK